MNRLPLVLVAAVLAGCASAPPPPLASVPSGWSEEGEASWYGPGFHGKRTASGEVYDMEALTAAHPTLPFDTKVKVLNLDNGRSVVVRVNDRGPFARGRIIDLSRAGARGIGMLGTGTARVRLTLAGRSPLETCSEVQVGAFSDAANARALKRRLQREGEPARTVAGDDGLTRVLLGPYSDPVDSERARKKHGGLVRPCS